ncbi:MAG: cupredoxin domain-containing protein [Ilumatobacteraceae bacterium]
MSDERPDSTDVGNPIGTGLRLVAAVAILIGGLVHLQLYLDGYRDFPDANLGRSFLLNVVASVIVAGALLLRRDAVVRIAGIALVVGTLIAFWLSRRGDGVFGLREQGLNPSPQAGLALAVELIALVALAATFVPALGAGPALDRRAGLAGAGAFLIATIVGGALWAQEADEEPQVAPSTSTARLDGTDPDDDRHDACLHGAASTAPPTTAAPDTTMRGNGTTMPGMPSTTTRPPRTTPPTTAAAPTTAAPTTQAPTTEAPASGVMEISIVDFNFDPAEMEVPVGTTVRWTNNDSFDHTVKADDGTFESETLGGGDTFEFTFETAGTFSYICGIHPSMQGTITVA